MFQRCSPQIWTNLGLHLNLPQATFLTGKVFYNTLLFNCLLIRFLSQGWGKIWGQYSTGGGKGSSGRKGPTGWLLGLLLGALGIDFWWHNLTTWMYIIRGLVSSNLSRLLSRETRLSNKGRRRRRRQTDHRTHSEHTQVLMRLTPHVNVCDHENFELTARQSKCPKTKINFKMLLFWIFIHRSGLIFHSINAFILHLFSSPLGALHIQMNKYRFTPGSFAVS